LRLVGWVVTVWIEFDAYRRARVRLERLGHWTADAEKEARRMLMSYIRPRREKA
jgi:Zn-dependent membrane protease YugP